MKIELKLSTSHLSFVNQMIADNLPLMAAGTTKGDKSAFSLMSEIADKLLKKAIDKRHTDTEFKVTLKYYQAYALHQFIHIFIEYEKTEKRRLTREVLGILNQKLS